MDFRTFTALDGRTLKARIVMVEDGRARVKPIEARSSTAFTTEKVTLTKRSASRAWGDKIDLKSDLSGVWIKLTLKGPDGEVLVREISSPENIMKKFVWDPPQEDSNEDAVNTEAPSSEEDST